MILKTQQEKVSLLNSKFQHFFEPLYSIRKYPQKFSDPPSRSRIPHRSGNFFGRRASARLMRRHGWLFSLPLPPNSRCNEISDCTDKRISCTVVSTAVTFSVSPSTVFPSDINRLPLLPSVMMTFFTPRERKSVPARFTSSIVLTGIRRYEQLRFVRTKIINNR
jgi:hypothetical protein